MFKRANVSQEVGQKAIGELIEKGIITMHTSAKEFQSWKEHAAIDPRVTFNTPFLRFWFGFVSPLFQGIKKGDFKEVKQRFENRYNELIQTTFTQLTQEALEMQPYFDRTHTLELYKKTPSNCIVGSVKYTNNKIKKSELTRLQTVAKEAQLTPQSYVIVSKKGFSKELKSVKGENLQLLQAKHIVQLLLKT